MAQSTHTITLPVRRCDVQCLTGKPFASAHAGEVFYSVAAALKYHSKQHTELLKALTATGLVGAVTDPKKPFTGTILAPTDAAFKRLSSAPSTADLKNILLNHVLKDELVLPGEVKEGTKYATAFPGHNVQFKFST